MQFNEDGSEVVYRSIVNDRLHVARWNSADGRVISPPPSPADLQGSTTFHEFTPDGRFGIFETIYPTRRAPWVVTKTARSLGAQWSGHLPTRVTITVVDMSTGLSLGFVNSAVRFDGSGIPHLRNITNQGFVVTQQYEPSYYYSLPPARNWAWLAGCTAGPLIAGSLLKGWRSRYGRSIVNSRRQTSPPSPAYTLE
jgi:hypothetical protein